MKVLIMNGHSVHKRFDIPKILKDRDPNVEITMICSSRFGHGSAKNIMGFKKIYTFEDYHSNPEVEITAWRVCEEGIDCIVAGNEKDILTAARLRSHFNIAGQKIEQALLFRDKFLMKQAAKEARLNTPAVAILSRPLDALEFVKKHSLPAIIKPRGRASSLGILSVANEKELKQALKTIFLQGKIERDTGTEYQIEKAIQGDMYSINGFVVGEGACVAWPNKVKGSWLELARHGESVFDFIMNPGAPEIESLLAFTKKILSNFGLSNSVFHLEVFIERETRSIYLCEIACRAPGLLITDCWMKMFGLSLDEISFLLQAGLDTENLSKIAREFDPAKRKVPAVGYLSIPCGNGVVRRTSNPAIDGVGFETLVDDGSQYSHSGHINSLALLGLIEANDETSLFTKAEELKRWYKNEVKWE